MNIICKHCGSDEGFYIKTKYYANVHESFNSDGTEQFSGTADSMQSKRGKNVYCSNCNKVICKVSQIENELE
ncbi:UNVERIFIED_ORG: hypothetical protein B2H98_10915 [Clostridium botulinum]